MKEVTINSQKYLLPSWGELDALCFALSQKMAYEKFDRLITLIKGGLAFSRTMCDYLNIPNLSAFQIKFYKNIGETNSKPEIIQPLPVEIKDETILLFDDVVDSGQSLKEAINYLNSKHPKKIVLASLFYKEKSILKPDFYGQITGAWIIFPNEIRETAVLLFKKWQTEGLSQEEISQRFLSLDFSPNQTGFFLKP